MLTGQLRGPLGDFRTDFVSLATPFVGATKAGAMVTDMETMIKAKAKEGVEAGIATSGAKALNVPPGTPLTLPLLKAVAFKAAAPVVIPMMALSLLGTVLGVVALVKLKKR